MYTYVKTYQIVSVVLLIIPQQSYEKISEGVTANFGRKEILKVNMNLFSLGFKKQNAWKVYNEVCSSEFL